MARTSMVGQRPPSLNARSLASAGFGIYELLLVMVIAGILLSIAAPSTGKAMRNTRVNRAAAVVQMDLRRAYSLAARQRAPVRIAHDASDRSYSVTDMVTGDELFTRHLGDKSEFKVQSLAFTEDTVYVGPNGFASSSLDVVIGANGYSRRVAMQRAGMVRVVPR